MWEKRFWLSKLITVALIEVSFFLTPRSHDSQDQPLLFIEHSYTFAELSKSQFKKILPSNQEIKSQNLESWVRNTVALIWKK